MIGEKVKSCWVTVEVEGSVLWNSLDVHAVIS